MGRHGCSGPASVALAVHLTVPFKVLALYRYPAGPTGQTLGVELLVIRRPRAASLVGFEILAFDTLVACTAKRSVQFVIVLCTVRVVIQHIEIGRLKW
jgi:hypothetical protein